MNQSKVIIKRIYSTSIEYTSQRFSRIPNCGECVHFYFQTQTCKKFACKSIVARIDPFKCSILASHFKPN
jgi:hypothetical protein